MGTEGNVPARESRVQRQPDNTTTSAEARLKAVLDAAVDAIITIDQRGTIETVNPATERIFGYCAAELQGRNVSMLMPAPFREEHDGYLARYLDTGEARIIGIGREVEAQRKDGTIFPCDLAVSEFELSGVRMFTGIIRDVSDRRHAEQQARLRLEELAHAGRLADLGLTTSTIAHEVNQPLTAIVGFANACQRMLDGGGYQPETLRTALGQIAEQGARASEVINRIRRLARKRDPVEERLDVNAAVRGVLSMLGDELRIEKVRLALDLGHDLPEVLGDRVHIEQVIMNLLRNALDALREVDASTRVLMLSTSTAHDGVRVTVRDSGPGIGAGQEQKIFESFYTTKPTGMGVGLAICRALAEAQGGRLWADPDRGDGATFHFTIQASTAP